LAHIGACSPLAHRLAWYVAFEIEYCQIHAACRAERHTNCSATLEIRKRTFGMRSGSSKTAPPTSMGEVCEMLVDGSLYIERNPKLVKSMTSFPYIASSI
jgi:hypothetical protein